MTFPLYINISVGQEVTFTESSASVSDVQVKPDQELQEILIKSNQAQLQLEESVAAIECAVPDDIVYGGSDVLTILDTGRPDGTQHLIDSIDELKARHGRSIDVDLAKWESLFRGNLSFRKFAISTNNSNRTLSNAARLNVLEENNFAAEVLEAVGRATKIACFERQDANKDPGSCVDLDRDGSG